MKLISFGPAHVTGVEALDAEARAGDQGADCAVEVTAAAESPPDRRQTVLPPANGSIRSATMLDKQETTGWFQHPKHFTKRTWRIGYAAQRPRGDNRVDACIIDRNGLGSTLDECDWRRCSMRGLTRPGE